MSHTTAERSQRRGRPPSNVKREIAHKVMAATEIALETKTVKEIKLEDIAHVVGVNPTIINYYFGGKDGLMEAMFYEIMREAPYGRQQDICRICIEKKTIRPLVEELAKFYYSRPALTRMILREISVDSSRVNAAYRRKYFASTPNLVSHVIESMVTSGLYNRHVDLQFATASLLSMLTAPLFNMSDKAGISDRLKSAAWIDHVSMMMDLAFCTGSSRQQP